MQVLVTVPTYNERGNIARLVAEVFAVTNTGPHKVSILVIDDESPDGTADEVRRLMATYPRLQLISGKKAGLGAAYVRGFRFALANTDAEVLVEMDADHSHKPQDLPRLLQAIDQGFDFAIGSRYVPGGSIPEGWGWRRKQISRWGNLAARYITGLRSVRDCTAGFRAIRASLLRRIDLNELKVQGYAFQVALLHAAVARDAKVIELPVDFVDRTVGSSKLGLHDIVEFIWNAWWIRLNSWRVFVKFLLVGASGVAVNLGLLSVLLMLGVNKYLASPVAIEASIVSNFVLNNNWTFRWRSKAHSLGWRGLQFNAISLLSLGISYSTFVVLSVIDPTGVPQLHQLAGIIPATMVNYFLNAYWTFKPATAIPPPPADGASR